MVRPASMGGTWQIREGEEAQWQSKAADRAGSTRQETGSNVVEMAGEGNLWYSGRVCGLTCGTLSKKVGPHYFIAPSSASR